MSWNTWHEALSERLNELAQADKISSPDRDTSCSHNAVWEALPLQGAPLEWCTGCGALRVVILHRGDTKACGPWFPPRNAP